MEIHSPPLSPICPEDAIYSPKTITFSGPIASRTRARLKSKPWIASPTEASGGRPRGASTSVVHKQVNTWFNHANKPELEQKIGGWLGLFIHMTVEPTDVLTDEESKYIALALQHNKLYNRAPCTELQYDELSHTNTTLLEAKLAVAEGRVAEDKDICKLSDRLELGCQCDLHTHFRHTKPTGSFADWLGRVMANASELQGDVCSGNLGNIAVELKLILEHGGLKHLQVQVEGKSKACGVGSKVTYIFGSEDDIIYVEGTPDFYVRTTNPFHSKIVYLLIGECESESSDYPDTQLAISALGHLLDRTTNEIAAVLFMKKPLTATVFLGSADQMYDKTFVKFSSVNSSRGYHLMNQAQLIAFRKPL